MFQNINGFPDTNNLKSFLKASKSYLPFFAIEFVPSITVQMAVYYGLKISIFHKRAIHKFN